MKVFILSILLSGLLATENYSIFSSNFIGMPKSDIKKVITEKHKSFKLNTSTTNTKYNYLKFEDSINEITLLFFLSDNDVCTMIRLMSDYSNINDFIGELDNYYTKISDNNWEYQNEGKIYSVNLEEGDWFFTISIREKE